MAAPAVEGRRRVLELLTGGAEDRSRAIELAEILAADHPQLPLARITLASALGDVRAGPEERFCADGLTLRLERAWREYREALCLGTDEGQSALCSGSMLALEQRIDALAATAASEPQVAAAAAEALERMRAAEPVTAFAVGALVPASDEGTSSLLAMPLPAEPMRVTLLSGFLGAGKTTLLRRILTGTHGRRVAVVVNDMAELNIDARLVRQDATASAASELDAPGGAPLVELSNGCICCTLRADLVEQLATLGRSGCYELCIVESTGVSEPLAVAQAFAQADAQGVSLSLLARLDTMVTVLDASAFLADLTAGDSLQQRSLAVSPTDARDVATLMVEQLEVADVVIVNKADLAPEGRLRALEAFVRATNRTARVLRAVRCDVALGEVVGTGRFDLAAAASSAGWVRELMGEHAPETEAYGIVSHVYASHRPFDAGRLWEIVTGDPAELRGVLRSKGYAWVAQQPALVLEWQTAGVDTDCRVAGTWAAPAASAPPPLRGEYGSRKTELVFIGMRLDRSAIDSLLDTALVSDAELAELEAARLADGELGAPSTAGALEPLPDGMAAMIEGALSALVPPAAAESEHGSGGGRGAVNGHGHRHDHGVANGHAHCLTGGA